MALSRAFEAGERKGDVSLRPEADEREDVDVEGANQDAGFYG